MKITLKSFNCKGFLIIELMVALAIFAILVLAISAYQLHLQLYRQAAWELYSATSLCENIIEECWSGLEGLEATQKKDQFEITTIVTPGPNQAFKFVQISATWMNALKRLQTIQFDVICL